MAGYVGDQDIQVSEEALDKLQAFMNKHGFQDEDRALRELLGMPQRKE